MKSSRITDYDPTLSVEENAANNNVTTAAMRSYIKSKGIDRTTDRQIFLYKKVKEYVKSHPDLKAPKIALDLNLSANTVRKYLKMQSVPRPKKKKVVAMKFSGMNFLSASDSQTDILKAILALHMPKHKTFQCDLTAWKLGFYVNGLQRPKHCYDKYASELGNDDIKDLDCFDSDWADGTFENIIIDLPCSVKMPSTKSRFDCSTHFSSIDELLVEHKKMLRLAYRKLQNNGFLVYKTMDFKFFDSIFWLSDEVLNMAKEIGFNLVDKFIFIDRSHMKVAPRRTKFTVSIPAHAYFFVFQKRPIYRSNIGDEQ